jgi:8-oxo-dGTP pyrophosphatase MutT (NUDIX family)
MSFKRLKVMPKEPLQIVCCLVFDRRGRLLLLRRHADDLGGGLWATPGGRRKPDEDSATTAVREVQEETGLGLRDVEYLGKHELAMPHGVVHMKTYKARVNGDEVIVIDPEEHEAYQWFKVPDLLTAQKIIWGLPTTLADFGFLEVETDPTVSDGSTAILLQATV